MKNDNFNQQTRVDRPILPGGLEICGLCDGGGCIVSPANRSSRFTICRSTCRSTTPAYHQYRKGLDDNVREQNVPGGLG
jgi:hypothetical protein